MLNAYNEYRARSPSFPGGARPVHCSLIWWRAPITTPAPDHPARMMLKSPITACEIIDSAVLIVTGSYADATSASRISAVRAKCRAVVAIARRMIAVDQRHDVSMALSVQ